LFSSIIGDDDVAIFEFDDGVDEAVELLFEFATCSVLVLQADNSKEKTKPKTNNREFTDNFFISPPINFKNNLLFANLNESKKITCKEKSHSKAA
jgi:5'-3' exonuclease